MKISETTMGVLKNFALIHHSLIVNEPKCIVTMSRARNVVAVFDTEEEFPVKFGIYTLREFLAAVALFDLAETDFDFKDKWVRVKYKGSSIKYSYTRIEHIENSERYKPSEKYKGFSHFDCKFPLSEEHVLRIKRASAVMFGSSDYTNVRIFSDGAGEAFIKLDYDTDGMDPMANNFKVALEGVDGKCNINFNVEHLKLYKGNYDVSVLGNRMVKFAHTELPLMYFIMAKVAK